MYARSTTFHGDPHRIDEAIAYIRDRAMPALMGMDGFVGISMLADRRSGRSIVTSSFEDLAALRRSASEMRGIRARTADILQSPQALQEWQIALLHRLRSAPDGARARVTWCRTDPERLEALLEAYAESIVPRLPDQPGFCSVSVLADPVEGGSVTAVTWTDEASLEQADRELAPLLRQLGRRYDGEVTDDAVFELVLAHLRVPETV
jgi:heme-degrading monooxygenase HmoA